MKIISFLILPPASLLILMAAGFIVLKKNRLAGRILVSSGFVLLYLLSIGPVSNALIMPLEKTYPPLKDTSIKVNVIVVLGGGVRDLSWLGLEPETSEASLERLITGVRLYRKLHIPLVLAGGSGDPSEPDIKDADAMARAALSLGVPAKDVIVENKSRNTVESAKAMKNIIKGKRIVLATSAFHMKRAAAMFKKQGFEVVPAPTGYLTGKTRLSCYSLIPHAHVLGISAAALHEYLGILWYKIKGDISE